MLWPEWLAVVKAFCFIAIASGLVATIVLVTGSKCNEQCQILATCAMLIMGMSKYIFIFLKGQVKWILFLASLCCSCKKNKFYKTFFNFANIFQKKTTGLDCHRSCKNIIPGQQQHDVTRGNAHFLKSWRIMRHFPPFITCHDYVKLDGI